MNESDYLEKIWGLPLLIWLIFAAILGIVLIVVVWRSKNFHIRFKGRDREFVIEVNCEKKRDLEKSKKNDLEASQKPMVDLMPGREI